MESVALSIALKAIQPLTAAERKIIAAQLKEISTKERLSQRDDAIRRLAGGDAYRKLSSGWALAEAIAGDLTRGNTQNPEASDPEIQRILSLNGGKSLKKGQVRNILAGLRKAYFPQSMKKPRLTA